MRGTWSSLWYKELHEQKWRSLALTCIMLGILLMNVWVVCSDNSRIQYAMMFILAVTYAGLPGALFIAMGVAAGERSNQTLAFTRALPVPGWRLATVRIAAGAVSVLVPSIITWLGIAVWLFALGPRMADLKTHWQMSEVLSPVNELLICFAVATGMMISVYLWTVAVGARQRTEIRAGVAGIIALVGWAVLCFIVYGVTHRWSDEPGVTGVIVALSPIGLGSLLDPRSTDIWPVVLCLQSVTFVALAAAAIARWGRATAEPRTEAANSVPTAGDQNVRLMAPRASEFSALAWKQWRDSLPFCAVGLCFVFGWTALLVLDELSWGVQHAGPNGFMRGMIESILALTAYVGVFVALIVGVGTFVSEVQPGLMTFWRSRPISPSMWFWTKYLTGLAAVMLFLLVPILLFLVGAWTLGGEAFPHGEPFGRSRVGPWSFVLALTCATCLAFSIAVCLTCLVRQAVYAGILALGLFLGVFSITSFLVWVCWPEWLAPAYQFTLFSSCTSVFAVVFLVLAWQSAVRDWGQKC